MVLQQYLGHTNDNMLGQCAGDAGTSQQQAQQHFAASADAFQHALQNPAALGGFEDRCNVRYNFSCACCLSGRANAAVQTLQALLACGGTNLADVMADEDLVALRPLLSN